MSWRPVGNKCFLHPELERVRPMAQGIDCYELTGVPRTPAYARVWKLGRGVPYETIPKVREGQVVFVDLSHAGLDCQLEGKRTWTMAMDLIRAIVDEPHAQPIPLNDFVLTERAPEELIRNVAPALAEIAGFKLPESQLSAGFASGRRETDMKHKVFTYKFERVVDMADGRFVGRGFRPHDREAIGGIGLFKGLRSMPITWRDVNDNLHQGSITPWTDFEGVKHLEGAAA